MGKIPDRWLQYKPIGEQIEGTHFIAFKVPLSAAINESVDDVTTRLDISQLAESIPNLGLVIDLTNTHRYYHPEALKERGIKHVKLMCPGHQIPEKTHRDLFSSYVKEFLENEKNTGKLIGVHCTHGVNRTGVLICHHMVTSLKVEPQVAVIQFEAARGHRIERENYRDFIFRLTTNGENGSDDGNSDIERIPPVRDYKIRDRSPLRRQASSYDRRNRSPRRTKDNSFDRFRETTRRSRTRSRSPSNWKRNGFSRPESSWRRSSPSRNNYAPSYGNQYRPSSRSQYRPRPADRFHYQRDDRRQNESHSSSRRDPLPSNSFSSNYSVMDSLYGEDSSRERRGRY